MTSRVETVLITGATSGIGRALALEFASRGYCLFITGRNIAELERLAAEVDVEAEHLAADLSSPDDRRQLCEAIAAREIDILVNNAGFGVKGDFAETDLASETDLVEVQITAMLELTKAALPGMKERGRGAILNVASVYSFSPVPQQSVYAATKAFMFSFSSSIRAELAAFGIQVSVLAPGITQTDFRRRAGVSDKGKSGLTAEEVARTGVAQFLKGRELIVPGVSNKLFVFLARHLPTTLTTRLIKWVNARRGVSN